MTSKTLTHRERFLIFMFGLALWVGWAVVVNHYGAWFTKMLS